MTLNIAIIGAGGHGGQVHAPALRRYMDAHPGIVGDVYVGDIAYRQAEDVRAAQGFQATITKPEEWSGRRVDAVMLTVPPSALLTAMQPWLERRVPLLIEKPLGRTWEDALAIQAAAEKADCPVLVSMNRRFDPAVSRARDWVKGRGPLRTIEGRMLRERRCEPEFLWATGIHLLDTLCFLAGPLQLQHADIQDKGLARWVAGTAVCPNGPACTFVLQPTAGQNDEWIRLAGDGYSVELWTGSVHPWRIRAWENGRQILDERAAADEPADVRSGTYAETCAFLDGLGAGRKLSGPGIADVLVAGRLAWELQAPARPPKGNGGRT